MRLTVFYKMNVVRSVDEDDVISDCGEEGDEDFDERIKMHKGLLIEAY